MSTEVITVLVALTGGGGIAAIITAVTSWRKGVRDADVNEGQTAIQGFRELAESLREEVDRLKVARQEDRAESAREREKDRDRIDRIERQIAVERDLRWSAIQYVRILLAWVSQHLPGMDPPAVPDDLAEHISTSRKDES